MSETLYTTKDVTKVREKLYEEQDRIDPITGLEIPKNQIVLDHDHKTQFVRAVLHRQTNAVLGKIENLWTRYLSYWYTGTLSEFLRGCADYIEKKHPTDYVHPKWVKRVTADFNKLTASEQNQVLKELHQKEGKNPTERKKLFKSLTADRELGYITISETIKRVQDE